MDRNEAWYIKTIPTNGTRSKDAYIRERLNQRRQRIKQRVEHALWENHVELGTLESEEIGTGNDTTIDALTQCASKWIIKTLIEEIKEEEGFECSVGQGEEAWGRDASEHARKWLQDKAPASQWNEIMRAIQAIKPDRRDGALTMRRLVELARKGPDFARKLRTCDPWAAREACWNFPDETLDRDAKMWAICAVQGYAKALDRNHDVNEADAKEALKHWRWPTMRPPLQAVAASAGRMAPLRTDSAWANALSKAMAPLRTDSTWANDLNGAWHAASLKYPTSIEEQREGEESAEQKIIAEIEHVARKSILSGVAQAWCDSPDEMNTEQKRSIVEQCKKEWKESDDLEGDGSIGQARLDTVEDSIAAQMMWVFNINGPETLLAGCRFEGKTIVEAFEKYDMRRIALAMTTDKSGNHGHLFEHKSGAGRTRMKQGKALWNIIEWTTQR